MSSVPVPANKERKEAKKAAKKKHAKERAKIDDVLKRIAKCEATEATMEQAAAFVEELRVEAELLRDLLADTDDAGEVAELRRDLAQVEKELAPYVAALERAATTEDSTSSVAPTQTSVTTGAASTAAVSDEIETVTDQPAPTPDPIATPTPASMDYALALARTAQQQQPQQGEEGEAGAPAEMETLVFRTLDVPVLQAAGLDPRAATKYPLLPRRHADKYGQAVFVSRARHQWRTLSGVTHFEDYFKRAAAARCTKIVVVRVPTGTPYIFFFNVGSAIVPTEQRAHEFVEAKTARFVLEGLEEPSVSERAQVVVQGTKAEVAAALVAPDLAFVLGSRGGELLYEAVGALKSANPPLPFVNLEQMLSAENASSAWATVKFDFAVKTVHQRLTLMRQIGRAFPALQLRMSGFEVRAFHGPSWTWELKAAVMKIGGVKGCYVDGRIPSTKSAATESPLQVEQNRAAAEEEDMMATLERGRQAGGDVRLLEVATSSPSDRTLLFATADKLGETLKNFTRAIVIRLSAALAVPAEPIVAVGGRMALYMTAPLRV